MGYRQIYIKKSEKLSCKDNQLVVTKENNNTKIPLEDINFIIVEDCTTIITTRLLAELGKNAISLIICDEKYIPTSIMYPYNYHYKQLENLELQLNYTEPLKPLLWQSIIRQKILNQIKVLEIKSCNEKVIVKLEEFLSDIKLADQTNREGLVAKMYFKNLFGSSFIRHYEDGINDALNYGYTILVSCIIRTISVYGLLTYYGINHRSKTNNFNLAFDLVEPFRPIVDKIVIDNYEEITSPLSSEIRKQLINIINQEVRVNNQKCTVEYAIDLLIKSFIKSLASGEVCLDLPNIT